MTWMVFVLAFMGQCISLLVILALLRQANNDRKERESCAGRYRELALRVRAVQLEAETPVENGAYRERMMEPFAEGFGPSTTTQMDGKA